MSASFTVQRGMPILVIPRMADLPYTFSFKNGVTALVKVRIGATADPNHPFSGVDITLPQKITFSATEETLRVKLQALQKELSTNVRRLIVTANMWETKEVDQKQADAVLAKLKASAEQLLPMGQQKKVSDAAKDVIFEAVAFEQSRLKLIDNIESFNKIAAELIGAFLSSPNAVTKTAVATATAVQGQAGGAAPVSTTPPPPAASAAPTSASANVPAHAAQPYKAALTEIHTSAQAFFQELDDPNGNKRKILRNIEFDLPITGRGGICRMAYPMTDYVVTDLIHLTKCQELVGATIVKIYKYAESNNFLMPTFGPPGAKPVTAKPVQATPAAAKK